MSSSKEAIRGAAQRGFVLVLPSGELPAAGAASAGGDVGLTFCSGFLAVPDFPATTRLEWRVRWRTVFLPVASAPELKAKTARSTILSALKVCRIIWATLR